MYRRGFTLLQLLIVLAIISLLMALLLPAFWNAREKARQSACLTNLKQINTALGMYLQDNDSTFPDFDAHISWTQMLRSYTRDEKVFRCPACIVPAQSEGGPGPWGYAINSYLSLKEWARNGDARAETDIPFPATTVSFCETSFFFAGMSGPGRTEGAFQPESNGPMDEPYDHDARYVGVPSGLRHQGGSHYSFVDGHVRWYKPEQVQSARHGNSGQSPSFALKRNG